MNESVIVASWFDERHYRITKQGKDYYIASVTTKLNIESKPFLGRWRGDIGNREADMRVLDAGNRGKRIHAAFSIYLLGGVVLYNPWRNPIYSEEQVLQIKKDANGVFILLQDQGEMVDVWKLQRFVEMVCPKIVESELIVYSIEDDIAGTLDLAIEVQAGKYLVNGAKELIIPKTGLYIADLKSGKHIDNSMWRQLAPYCHAYKKMGKGDPIGAMILHTQAETRSGIPGFGVKLCMKEELDVYLDDYFHLAAVWKRNNPNAGPEIFNFPTKIQRRTLE